jgi:PilZ domain
MENRRQHYRFAFAPTRRLPVHLGSIDGQASVAGKIVNLSIWGICVSIEGPGMPPGDRWYATFALEPDAEPLTLLLERVYAQDGTETCCGFRFLRTLDLKAQEERERTIWRFLLEEQRRERREAGSRVVVT